MSNRNQQIARAIAQPLMNKAMSGMSPGGRMAFQAALSATKAIAQATQKRRRARGKGPVFPRLAGIAGGSTQVQTVGVPGQFSTTQRNTPPMSQRVAGTELIAPITPSGSAFSTYFAVIDATDDLTWPRLCALASQYEKFTVNSLVLIYRGIASTAVTGNIMLAFVPDRNMAAPTSIDEMMSYAGAVTSNAYTSVELPVPQQYLAGITRSLFVRDLNSTDNLNNAGKFVWALKDCSVSTVIGTLSVKYDITVTQPVSNLSVGAMAVCPVHVDNTNFILTVKGPRPPIICNDTLYGFVKRRRPALFWLIAYDPADVPTKPTITFDGVALPVTDLSPRAAMMAVSIPPGPGAVNVDFAGDDSKYTGYSILMSHRPGDLLNW